MRPPSVYAKPSCPAGCACDVARMLFGPHRVAARLVMILLSCQRWPPAAIAELLGCDPATVRCWIHRYNTHGPAGLSDRPRAGRPRRGSPRLGQRILRLLVQPMAWTIPRLWSPLAVPPSASGPCADGSVRSPAGDGPGWSHAATPTATRSSPTFTSSQYQVGAAAVVRIRQAEQLPMEPDRTPAELPRPGAAPAAVAFDQVHFRYRPSCPRPTAASASGSHPLA
jgi:hypothetical protein